MTIADAAARELALDPQQSFIVQAPAGSGKTGLLVYRYLNLLTQVEKPENVLAITFTRKARAEMLERVLELLQAAQDQDQPKDSYEAVGLAIAQRVLARDQQRQWGILSAPNQLQILTIDSFSGRLAGSMPWLSRLGDRPRTTDQASAHYAAATEQVLDELLSPGSSLQGSLKLVLHELDFNYQKARQLFSSMLAKRDQWLRHLLCHDFSQLRQELEVAWENLANEAILNLRELSSNAQLQSMLALAIQAANQIDFASQPGAEKRLIALVNFDGDIDELDISHWQALASFLLTKQGAPRKSLTKNTGVRSDSPSAKHHKEQTLALLAEIADDAQFIQSLAGLLTLPNPHFEESDWELLVALEAILKALAVRLQLRFRQIGEFDHSEVTQRANLALAEMNNPTDLGLQLDGQIQHILVDEFQDTSHSQITLLQALTNGWQPTDELPKTLFLVGDPMQSIYRFREADVSLFLQVVDNQNTQIFPNVEISPLSLKQNFRSSNRLVEWFNGTFTQSFPARDDVLTGGISYAPAASNKAGADFSPVDYVLAEDKQQEAELCLKSVQEALANLPDENAKVAILVRSRPPLDYLLPPLDAAGIDYVAVDIQPLRDQQAIQDIIALAKSLCRPDDRIAWLSLLRGPWCGLTLAEIQLFANRGHSSIWEAVQDPQLVTRLVQSSQQRVKRFTNVMQRCLAQYQQVDLGSLTRWAWQQLGGVKTLGITSIDDAEQVFELLNAHQRGGDMASDAELNSALDALRAGTSAESSAKVVISTAHKAKGLQYHTVILPALANKGRGDEKDILMWAEYQAQSGERRLLLAPLVFSSGSGQSQSSHYDYLRQLEQQRAKNEAVRLMYVACTRAEQKLVLIANTKRVVENDEVTDLPVKPDSTTLISSVWSALESQFHYHGASPSGSTELLTPEVLPQTLRRFSTAYVPDEHADFDWAAPPSHQASEVEANEPIVYDWATRMATAVGIVLHEFLQYQAAEVLNLEIDQSLKQRWRLALTAQGVTDDRLDYALQRMVTALKHIQADEQAHFIFKEQAEAVNEYALSTLENGVMRQYRIDRTFIDAAGTRWIVDYKSTVTRGDNVDAFVEQQVAERHKPQLDKYGELMSKLDTRPIKLAVYFPLLKVLKVWDYLAH